MAQAFIGTSGWVYPHWKGLFYPEDLPASKFLEYYSQQFETAEVNNSFYRLPSHETYEKWADTVDSQFVFAVKASRYLTHMKKLKDPDDPWHRVTDAASGLEKHLGPILLQFPKHWQKNLDRLREFLTIAADENHALAFEFRDPSWFEEDTYKLLKKHGAALCIADSTTFPRHDVVTADFVYIRYHGRDHLYAGNYSNSELKSEEKKIRKWLNAGLDVYVYFNNDGQARAVKNARTLIGYLS